MRLAQEESIALLLQDDGGFTDSNETLSVLETKPCTRGLRWTSLILPFFVLADLLLFLFVFQRSASITVGELEYRDSYIGLKALYESGRVKPAEYKPLIIPPRISTQVSSAQPHKVYPGDHHGWLKGFGTVSSRNRHLQVSSQVHSIVQFRTTDFGMERCALALRLPPLPVDDTVSQPFLLGDNGGEMRVDVCKSNVSRPLDVSTLSFATRPLCQHVGSLSVTAGEEARLPEFPCSWASLHTYEISCAPQSPSCNLDVWSNENVTWGMVMYQFQTLGRT